MESINISFFCVYFMTFGTRPAYMYVCIIIVWLIYSFLFTFIKSDVYTNRVQETEIGFGRKGRRCR